MNLPRPLSQLSSATRLGIHALVRDAEVHDGFPALSDAARIALDNGDPDGIGVVRHDGDRVAAYAQASPVHDGYTVELVVPPGRRGQGVEPQLLGALVDAIALAGGGHVTWWVFHGDPTAADVAAAVGLAPARELYQMRRPLPLDLTTDVVVRPFEVGRDEQAWVEVNNAAFAWHPEQGGWDVATLRLREAEPWFDPAGFLLHERDGRLAAFCWTKLHLDTTPRMGEIYVIAVHPDFHGTGLGTALTIAGLASIAARGITVGMLHVDASNTSAVALYRRLGFEIHHVDRAYSGILEGAPS